MLRSGCEVNQGGAQLAGELGRGLYIVVGLALFLIKWNLDRLLSGYFFSVSWMPYRYLIPGMDGLDEALEGVEIC